MNLAAIAFLESVAQTNNTTNETMKQRWIEFKEKSKYNSIISFKVIFIM